jgi:glycosyltransferase involved in cell wall biosynthesis
MCKVTTHFPLVSVIIPCYNAERWVAEAIQSCLDQTYRPIEIIVIDDGSTDGSLDVIKSFGDAVKWETGPNRGGNAARNRGFALSQGEYIQFLDADDYILPEKIARQVQFLQETGADVVYSDAQNQHHKPDGTISLSQIPDPGKFNDVTECLLANRFPGNVNYHLFCRKTVTKSGGWDERLQAMQDRDFMLSVALVAEATMRYLPGKFTIIRRYGNTTVSTSNPRRVLVNNIAVTAKAETLLANTGRLTENYRKALAVAYFKIARGYFDFDRDQYALLVEKSLSLNPNLKPNGTHIYKFSQAIFGFFISDLLASYKRKVEKLVSIHKHNYFR